MIAPSNPTAEGSDLAPSWSLDLRDAFGALLKYKWVILGCAALVTLAVLFWTLGQPKIYEATCSLEYNPSPPRPLGQDVEDVAQPISNFWLTREFYETQNKIIGSRLVAESAVKALALHKDPDFVDVPEGERKNWRGITVERAAELLRKRISIEPIKETRIVLINAQDKRPEMAQALANAVAQAYLDKTVEDRSGSTHAALSWLLKEQDSLSKRLDKAEIKLYEFKRDNNVLSVSMEDRQNIVANQIERFTESLTQAKTRRIELAAKLDELRTAKNEDPFKVHASAIEAHEGIRALKTEYETKSAELAGLLQKYGDSHPQIRALQAHINDLRSHIHKAVDGVVASAAADLREAQAIENGLQHALEDSNRAGLELNLQTIEHQRLNRERENTARLYSLLLERTTETDLTRRLSVKNVSIVDPALKPRMPVKPRIQLNVGLGLLGGLLGGIAIALFLRRMDRTLRLAEDIEALGVPVLGVLPMIDEDESDTRRGRKRRKKEAEDGPEHKSRDLIVYTHPRSSIAECCRTIRTNLTFVGADRPLNVLVVTSPGPRDGKTTVAVSLAVTLAQSSKRVLLIDTDMRRPRIHRIFGVSSEVGITSMLVGERKFEECVQATEVDNLFVLPCGPVPPNPSELLHTALFGKLVEQVRHSFDRVIFDSPPIGAVTDAAVIAPQIDGAILVAKARHTTREALAGCARQLHDIAANVAGGILNEVDLRERGYGYRGSPYYYYYYGNYNTTASNARQYGATQSPG